MILKQHRDLMKYNKMLLGDKSPNDNVNEHWFIFSGLLNAAPASIFLATVPILIIKTSSELTPPTTLFQVGRV